MLQACVDREKSRSANLSAALDLAKSQAVEELEQERQIINQLREELSMKQVRQLLISITAKLLMLKS